MQMRGRRAGANLDFVLKLDFLNSIEEYIYIHISYLGSCWSEVLSEGSALKKKVSNPR